MKYDKMFRGKIPSRTIKHIEEEFIYGVNVYVDFASMDEINEMYNKHEKQEKGGLE